MEIFQTEKHFEKGYIEGYKTQSPLKIGILEFDKSCPVIEEIALHKWNLAKNYRLHKDFAD